MTREVKAHGKGNSAMDVVQEMGLDGGGSFSRGPVSLMELALSCRCLILFFGVGISLIEIITNFLAFFTTEIYVYFRSFVICEEFNAHDFLFLEISSTKIYFQSQIRVSYNLIFSFFMKRLYSDELLLFFLVCVLYMKDFQTSKWIEVKYNI